MKDSRGDSGRAIKLTGFFNSVLQGDQTLRTGQNGNLFIEALCGQPDPPTCIEKIIASPHGLSSVQTSMRFNASASFQNGPATKLLKYIQDPALKIILGGSYLEQLTVSIVEPPIFWNAFAQSLRNGSLNVESQQCFGWLLCELLCLPSDQNLAYRLVAQDTSIQNLFLESSVFELRILGQKFKHILSTYQTPGSEDPDFGPGGRHDNDFVDFREVAIHPTADELLSEEEPFLRLADAIEDPDTEDTRLVTHLDNQFRLLREDMLGEMRDELQIIFGKKKGRHRGLIVEGFTVSDINCGDPKRRQPWALQLQATSDLSQLFHCRPKDRKQLLMDNRNLFRHQSLACLILDGEVVAFPTIHRDIDQLANKLPLVTLQFTGKSSTSKALLKMKTARSVKLVQIDTAVFAFEPVLKILQGLKGLPLAEALLFWNPKIPMTPPDDSPAQLMKQLRNDPTQDLQDTLETTKSVQLDQSQMLSLLTGLEQRVSLIQGPPGRLFQTSCTLEAC